MRRNTIALLAVAAVLAVAGFAVAQTPAGTTPNPPARSMMGISPQDSGMAMGTGTGMMSDGRMGSGDLSMSGNGFPEPDLAAMDARLDGLVRKMDRATGKQKIGAMAAVLDELVAQRKELRSALVASERRMMGPMVHQSLEHMARGMMQGMATGMMQGIGPASSMGMGLGAWPCSGVSTTAPQSGGRMGQRGAGTGGHSGR